MEIGCLLQISESFIEVTVGKKKVGIYAKWIDTLGGGEKVATVMAETLSRAGYEADLISTFKPNKENIESKMDVNLTKVRMVTLKERSYEKIKKVTAKYDIFVNTSFLDVQPSLAKKSVYYLHFPTQVKRTFLGFIKYETILPFLRKFLIIPFMKKGFEVIDDVVSRAGVWLGKENTVIFSNPPENFKLKLRIFSGFIATNTVRLVEIKSPNATTKLLDRNVDHFTSTLNYEYEIRPRDNKSVAIDIKIRGNPKKFGMALVSLTVNNARYLLWNLMKKFLPRYEMALYGSGVFKPEGGLDTYDLFLCNSNYTKKWTKRYWGKNARVLYPPVEVNKFKPSRSKRNMILNVGRFFVGGHSKKQDVLIQAFKKLIDGKMIDKSWELHLVGGIASGWEHAHFTKRLQEEAKGYLVYFHFSLPFKELKKLYAKAKIYWHATGFGQNRFRNPIAFEHFGITVVEAMAAGAVPLVFKGGGLPETVTADCGFVWRTINQLTEKTTQIIKDRKQLTKLSKKARGRAKLFSRTRFEKEFLQLIKKNVR